MQDSKENSGLIASHVYKKNPCSKDVCLFFNMLLSLHMLDPFRTLPTRQPLRLHHQGGETSSRQSNLNRSTHASGSSRGDGWAVVCRCRDGDAASRSGDGHERGPGGRCLAGRRDDLLGRAVWILAGNAGGLFRRGNGHLGRGRWLLACGLRWGSTGLSGLGAARLAGDARGLLGRWHWLLASRLGRRRARLCGLRRGSARLSRLRAARLARNARCLLRRRHRLLTRGLRRGSARLGWLRATRLTRNARRLLRRRHGLLAGRLRGWASRLGRLLSDGADGGG